MKAVVTVLDHLSDSQRYAVDGAWQALIEIRDGLSGQLCRCTGYDNIIKAVRWAAEHQSEGATA